MTEKVMANPVKIFVVDDHPMARKGVQYLLQDHKDIEVVGEAANGEEALRKIPQTTAGVVLLDWMMPGMKGGEICRQLKALTPQIKVLFVTSTLDGGVVKEAIDAQADGFLLKEVMCEELADGIRNVAAGQVCFDQRVSKQIIERMMPSKGPAWKLNPQEKKVLTLVAEGLTNKEVGLRLNLTEKTVRNYLSLVMSTLGVKTRTEAAAVFFRLGENAF